MNVRLRELMAEGVETPVPGGTQYEVLSNRPTRELLRELGIRFVQTTCNDPDMPYYGKRVVTFTIYDSDHAEHPDFVEQHIEEMLDQSHHEDGNVALAEPTMQFMGVDVVYEPELYNEDDERKAEDGNSISD